ncbi:hemolysin family protein [Jatrophihabitans fulvus]
MDNPVVVVVVTFAIIAASAFFVAVEFAVIAAKKHRLEDTAASSRSARAALRSASELTLLLAGSQLGITVCTLALGAISKPAVHYWLTPVFEGWGLARWAADAIAFVLALVVVTFLHLVVGEMAPKSWAIAHPERSATMLALPMRAFMLVFRPTLRLLNGSANWCLRRAGVEPADELANGQDPAALRQLVEHSGDVGTLDAAQSDAITTALDFDTTPIADLVRRERPTGVAAGATAGDVRDAARASGHLRILVLNGDRGADGDRGAVGVVHVRDTLDRPRDASLDGLVRTAFRLPHDTTLHDALLRMQGAGAQLAVVTGDDGAMLGVVTVTDVLGRLLRADGSTVKA